jgi:diguanylate cyclase (GGDEF)-like protein
METFVHPGRRSLAQDCACLLFVAALAALHAFPAQAARLHAVFMMITTVGGTALHLVTAMRSTGHARRVWSATAIGFACWAYAEVVVGVVTLATGHTGIRDLTTNLLNLLGLGFAVAAMLLIPTSPASVGGRMRMLLDGLIAAAALFGIVWVLIIGPMVSVEGTANALLDAAYPVLAAGVLALGVVVMAGTRGTAGAMQAITGGVLLIAVSLLLDLGTRGSGQEWSGPWFMDGYILAAALIAIAPLFPLPRREDREWRPNSTAYGVLPYLPMAGYAVVCVVPTFAGRTLDRQPLWAGTVLVCAVLTRQFLTIRRNIALSRDLAEQRARLADEAAHDSLTGLPNRARLGADLDRAGAEAVLLMIDLDGFKAVNDTLGHAAGDQLLVTIAARLRAAAADRGALCARLGGDEFAVLLTGTGLGPARDLAATLLRRCAEPVPLDGRIARVRASIGIAAGAPADLLREADLALYEAKHHGKGQYRVFDQALSAAAEDQRRLETELGEALAEEQFTLVYRPVVALATDAPVGAEQLLRWQHPRLGELAAEEFLPAAADAGLLPEIDRWVVQTAVADLAEWRRADPAFRLALRLSTRYLASGMAAADLGRVLAAHQQPADRTAIRLRAEDGMAELEPMLAEVRALGVDVILESFGMGDSAVLHLRDLGVDVIKLSPAFLTDLDTVPEAAVLLGAVVARAEGLGIPCVAGGVTTPEQAGALRRLGCRAAEGTLFGSPVPATELTTQIEYA